MPKLVAQKAIRPHTQSALTHTHKNQPKINLFRETESKTYTHSLSHSHHIHIYKLNMANDITDKRSYKKLNLFYV